jgi:hypothetical protein
MIIPIKLFKKGMPDYTNKDNHQDRLNIIPMISYVNPMLYFVTICLE